MGPTTETSSTYQVLVTSDQDKEMAEKRRALYIRPFLLFWINNFIFEVLMLLASVLVFSGLDDMLHKVLWTLVICPLGMSGALGSLINAFCVDRLYGARAVQFCAVMSVLVLGGCNILCYNLDLIFGWFGAQQHYWWWHWRYPMIYLSGYSTGKLLFTEEGQEKLTRMGV